MLNECVVSMPVAKPSSMQVSEVVCLLLQGLHGQSSSAVTVVKSPTFFATRMLFVPRSDTQSTQEHG